jgi:hypothetical protein
MRLLLAHERLEDLVDAGDELETLRIQELKLLFDAQAEGRALAEVLLQEVC